MAIDAYSNKDNLELFIFSLNEGYFKILYLILMGNKITFYSFLEMLQVCVFHLLMAYYYKLEFKDNFLFCVCKVVCTVIDC